jgi:phosphatidylglycerophosphate synthase
MKQQPVNLPNAISAARIIVAPLIAILPLVPSPFWRAMAFLLYVVTAVSDYVDGWLARSRGLITDLGKALDPLADKLLLIATFIPMLVLQGAPGDRVSGAIGSALPLPAGIRFAFPFFTWLGTVSLPWWVVAIVLAREVFMTVFRGIASRRGVVIGSSWPAKWKAGMQYVWVGAAYFWFAADTLAQREGWSGAVWTAVANFNGIVGISTMTASVVLAVYSLVLYMRQYGALLREGGMKSG